MNGPLARELEAPAGSGSAGSMSVARESTNRSRGGPSRAGCIPPSRRPWSRPPGLAGHEAGVATVRLALDPGGPDGPARRHTSNPIMMGQYRFWQEETTSPRHPIGHGTSGRPIACRRPSADPTQCLGQALPARECCPTIRAWLPRPDARQQGFERNVRFGWTPNRYLPALPGVQLPSVHESVTRQRLHEACPVSHPNRPTQHLSHRHTRSLVPHVQSHHPQRSSHRRTVGSPGPG